MGIEINPPRFRANIYIDGANPWEEFNWIGHDVRLGEVVFTVDRKNRGCGATNVNPLTSRRNLDIPGSLRAAFGQKNLGIYLIAGERGCIALGDELHAPRLSHHLPPRLLLPSDQKRARVIASNGLPPATTFAPLTVRCKRSKSCGGGKFISEQHSRRSSRATRSSKRRVPPNFIGPSLA